MLSNNIIHTVTIVTLSLIQTFCHGKVDLYLSSEQTEALYGIKTDGLYYVRNGKVNQYAMTFQHQECVLEY